MRNRVFLTGRVGADPEVKTTQNGMMARFSLATWETYKDDQGQKKTITSWHKIVTWGKLAEWVQKWVKKGQELDIEGHLVYTQWTDKEGRKHYDTEVQPFLRKDAILFVSVKKSEPAASENTPAPEATKVDFVPDNNPAPPAVFPPENTPVTEPPDDLPF